MTTARFTRKIENFTCEFCGTLVQGNGYTNHCPRCLVSKHVDVNPGDRASECQGLMYPVALEKSRGKEYIVHRCEKCGFIRRNKVCATDNYDAVIALAGGKMEIYHRHLLSKIS